MNVKSLGHNIDQTANLYGFLLQRFEQVLNVYCKDMITRNFLPLTGSTYLWDLGKFQKSSKVQSQKG